MYTVSALFDVRVPVFVFAPPPPQMKIRSAALEIDSVVNRAARLIYAVGRGTHTSPLRELHWLPFSKRILFKLCLYVNEKSPSYLTNTITLFNPSRNLRSAQDTLRLVISRSHFVSVDKRFTIAASSAWNTLSLNIRHYQKH